MLLISLRAEIQDFLWEFYFIALGKNKQTNKQNVHDKNIRTFMIKNRNFQLLPRSFHEILVFLLLTELKGNSYLFCVVIIHAIIQIL